MSLVGIDLGSSAVKVAAYREDGFLLAETREKVTANHPQPGWWESDPEEVWHAVLDTLGSVAKTAELRRDPPLALAISASGREAFPVASNGLPLGPCIRTSDTRGAEIAMATATHASTDTWLQTCGRVPDRMDPVNRLLWWRENRPEVMARAAYFLGWHEFLTLRLGNRAVTDKSQAGKWLIYNLTRGHWSSERLTEFSVDPTLLPEIATWGEQVTTLRPTLARTLGLPKDLPVAVGAFDVSCAALGSGSYNEGVAGLACGSWESIVVSAREDLRANSEFLRAGISIGPHTGSTSLGVFALSPNGTVVVDWARKVTNLSIPSFEKGLNSSGPRPSPVMAVPHLSGATTNSAEASESRGALVGLTLASSQIEIVKAFMEGIAFELALTLYALRQASVKVETLRAAGGGARSAWWMQLKADLTGVPVEVVDQPETGTLGASLLAGLAVGVYSSLEEASSNVTKVTHCFYPNPSRARLYEHRLEAYHATVAALLDACCVD